MQGNAPSGGWDTAKRTETPLNHYRIGPLVYITEIEIPELPAIPELSAGESLPPGPQSVAIRLGAAPAALAAPLASSPSCEANAFEFLLRLPGVATYYVRKGVEVIVDQAAQAYPLDVRSYLLGNIFAVLCHQRGLLPLHASAIATPRGAVAFLGASGAGKSSLVAFLGRRGHRILADDICLIDPVAPSDARVLPVAPWLKLWTTTLDALGEPNEGLARIFVDDDKYRYTLQQDQAATPLAEIILLQRTEAASAGEAKRTRLEQLAPVHALHAVLDLTYQSWLVRATGQTETYFLRCGQVLQGVRVFRMHRPWGFHAIDTTIDALESHLAGGPEPRGARDGRDSP